MMPLPSVAPRRGVASDDACEIITAFPLATDAAWPSAAVFTFVMTSLGVSLVILWPGALRHGERQGVLLPSRSPWSFHFHPTLVQLTGVLVSIYQCSRGPTPARSRAATSRRARAAGAALVPCSRLRYHSANGSFSCRSVHVSRGCDLPARGGGCDLGARRFPADPLANDGRTREVQGGDRSGAVGVRRDCEALTVDLPGLVAQTISAVSDRVSSARPRLPSGAMNRSFGP